MRLRGKTVAVDFDGVLHAYTSGWTGYTPLDDPIEGARESVHDLLDRGVNVVVYTARADSKQGDVAVHAWLERHGFRWLPVVPKITAIAYVDDRAVPAGRARPWADVLADVEALS